MSFSVSIKGWAGLLGYGLLYVGIGLAIYALCFGSHMEFDDAWLYALVLAWPIAALFAVIAWFLGALLFVVKWVAIAAVAIVVLCIAAIAWEDRSSKRDGGART